jgi:glycosyltransferase involved in cell wall biosynthesis
MWPKQTSSTPGDRSEYWPVSIAMAVYNGMPFLREQLRTVLEQLCDGDELIVVDDCSTDDSRVFLRGLRDSRIILVEHERNLGVLASFEHALSLCRNQVILLCDQDDVWLPGKRDSLVAAFSGAPDVVVAISDAQVIDVDGKTLSPSFMKTRGGFKGDVLNTVIRNRYLGCAMAVRSRVVVAALPIPRLVPMHDMWLGIVGQLLGKTLYLPQTLLQYRRHANNASPSSRRTWGQVMLWRIQLIWAIGLRIVPLLRARGAQGWSSGH